MLKIHFIGIGGSGMNPLARISLEKGFAVSGSDIKMNKKIKKLISMGADIKIGHDKNNIPDDINLLVYSNAIDNQNIELKTAQKMGISIKTRAGLLKELFHEKEEIVIVGSHGKTTTTGMAASVLEKLEKDNSSYYIGGILKNSNKNGKYGKGKYAAVELDESDGSFLYFKKNYAIIPNIELEHVDYYKNEKEYFLKFAEFINNFEGKIFIEAGSYDKIKENVENSDNVIKIGLESGDLTPDNYDNNGFTSGNISVKMPDSGEYNILNSFFVYCVFDYLDVDKNIIKDGLESFKGVKRRKDIIYKSQDIVLIDDYGHHPTEIEKTFDNIIQSFDMKNFILLFQPHRYTRFKYFYEEFKEYFKKGDYELIIYPIYSASEKEKKNISSYRLYRELKKGGRKNIYYAESLDEGLLLLKSIIKKETVVVSFGAGDINSVLKNFRKRCLEKK